ncbi:MAG TPA: hypothetical protein DDY24_10175 [Alcaligenaceae bacterium]|nr:hypothetical protein [Alcaligenaceae bacterium]
MISKTCLRFVSIGLLALSTVLCRAQGLPGSPINSLIIPNGAQKNTAQTNATPPTNGATDKPIARTATDIDTQLAEVQKKIDIAKADLVKAKNQLSSISATNTPALEAAQENAGTLQKLIDVYAQNIDSLKDLKRLTDKAAALKKEKDNWHAPAGTAPWPLEIADEIQFSLMQWQYQVQHLSQRLIIVDQQIEDMKKTRARLEIEFRQVATDPEKTTKAESIRRHLEINSASISEMLLEKEVVSTEKQIALTHISIQKQNWNYYDNRFAFSHEDLEKTQNNLEAEIAKLRGLETQASSNINRTLDLAAVAKARLTKIESTPGASQQAITQAKREWRKADGQAEAVRLEREKHRAMIELATLQIQLWNIRHDLYSSNLNAETLDKVKERQLAIARRMNQGMQYLTQMIAEKSQTYFELTEQVKITKDPAEHAFLLELMKPITAQIDNARSLYLMMSRVNQLLEITQGEIQTRISNRSLRQQIDTIRVIVIGYAKAFWNYEIFAIDDTIVVDGRELKTKRSITIGKSIGAIMILIFGFMIISRLIKRMLAIAVNKAHLGASKSVVIGRWLMLLAGFTLIVTAFNLVEIPLSIFAFFGGALAIGVGFGTQNILKNLISGVILLIEKPIRLGDLVEIDGVTGVVTSIGIRFSTIHGAQGTDTLIPNSSLVEHKLVNWTYSTPDVRKEIKVTVAYNSDVETVRSILQEVCTTHPAIIGTPSPLVTLDDFGDNGLVFTVQCWMRIQSGLVIAQVLSELRVKILAAFKQAGIDLPFPQRVVQFDTSQPLEVNLMSQPGSQQA